MSVKAVCAITQLLQDQDESDKFVAVVSYTIFADLQPAFGTHDIHDISPNSSGSNITAQIEEAMKIFIEGAGSGGQVSFGPSDFVLLIPR